jgi:hypothetical protein
LFFNLTTPPIAAGGVFTINGDPYTSVVELTYWWANVTGNHTLEFVAYCSFQSDSSDDVSRVNVTVTPAKPTGGGLTPAQAAVVFVVPSVAIIMVATALLWTRMRKSANPTPKEGDPVAPMEGARVRGRDEADRRP